MEKGEIERKKGQVTIFILIAIVIFAVVLVLFYPRIKVLFVPAAPVGLVDECMQADIDKVVDRLSMQGGSLNPKLFFAYQGNNVEYLCYTNTYYQPCIMQQPLLLQHVEREIKGYIESRAKTCIATMKDEMEKRGYTVTSSYQGTDVEIVPGNINIIINAKVSVTKEGTQTFNKFDIVKKSSLYDLVILSTSILKLETRLGDIETMTYMTYYPYIIVEKLKQGDGSKVYIISDTNTDDTFMFATRSFAFPGGYKLRL